MKTSILFVALMAAMSAMGQQVNYSVSGTYTDNGKKVYLIDRLTDRAIDSVVVADGKFSFTGAAAQDAFLAVMAQNKRWMTIFFNDGTPVSVCLNDSTLKGSPLNERLTQYDIAQDVPNRILSAQIAALTKAEIQARQEELMEKLNKVTDDKMAFANKIFRDERQSLIPLAFAELYFYDNGIEAYDKLVAEQLPFSNHPFLKKAKDDIAAMLQPQDQSKAAFIGQPFTDLEMADPDGRQHKLSELVGEGKYVLVDFWASWCGPCRAEMPNVLEAYNTYHAKGFEVVGISFDQKKAAWVRAIQQLQLPWLQLSDLKGWECAAAPVYKVDAIPDNILIDPQGRIVARGLRGKDLQRRLQQLFGQ